MKKILILSIVVLLCGCSAKTLAWKDAASSFEDLIAEADQMASGYESYDGSDYIRILTAVKNGLEELSSGIKEEDRDNAETIYFNAQVLKQMAENCGSEGSEELTQLCGQIQDLVKGAYEKTSDFKDRKEEILASIDEVLDWNDESWLALEKRKRISWSQVKEAYETLEEETIGNLPKAYQISETDLEGYKNTIIANYTLIANGVSEQTRENADAVYEAAVSLMHYTEGINSVTADKVYRFASQACDYVKEAYGEKTEDPDYDFLKAAQDARKWTLSVWNELIKLIKL